MPDPSLPVNLLFSEYEMRIDYAARTDGQPVYQGFAVPGTATSQAAWIIYAFTYDGNNFVTRRRILFLTAWDNRVAAFA